jgi:hypothetical protein
MFTQALKPDRRRVLPTTVPDRLHGRVEVWADVVGDLARSSQKPGHHIPLCSLALRPLRRGQFEEVAGRIDLDVPHRYAVAVELCQR